MSAPTFADLNAAPSEDFVAVLGGIFEHSPWVAEGVADHRPFANVDALHAAMVGVVDGAPDTWQLALIEAHPDLAGKAARAGDLTEASTKEQAGAGLDTLSDNEFARFHTLNDAYKARFGFPFILAVKGHDKHSILAAFEARLHNDAEAERKEALSQIARIAYFRLTALF